MAQPQVGSSAPTKLSFAKIAAMPAPNIAPALPNIVKDSKSRSSNSVSQHVRTGSEIVPVQSNEAVSMPKVEAQLNDIAVAVAKFSLTQHDMNGSHMQSGEGSNDSLADDQSQLSSSSLKQQSFDTKSMASVTTFAMDEKESIRPDDSASVRAVDEDDVHPGLSRNSSFQQELETQPSLSKSHVRMLGPNVTIAARRYPYTTLTNPPRFGDLPVGPVPDDTMLPPQLTSDESSSPLIDEGTPRQAMVNLAPDEKLLEALSSPKDRLPLLQLEEKMIAFIAKGRDTMLELPPQNSFTRLLTHKLADYYNLAHHINDDNNSVRIFRTDYCTLPVSLAEIAKSVPVGSQQISHAAQVKIMRRVQLGSRPFSAGISTAASSSVPSKTTSENGMETNSEEGLQSPAEGTPNKDRSKLTREEREAQYKAARDRIFGDFQESVTSESGSTGDASASMSRSSSSSGKKKPRKHKLPKDDTFEARSSFVPSYTAMHVQPTYQQVYNDIQFPGGYVPGAYSPSAYGGAMSPSYQSFDPGVPFNGQTSYNSSSAAMYGSTDGRQNPQQALPSNFYGYQNPQAFQQQPLSNQMNGQYQQNLPLVMPPSPSWVPNQFPPMYSPGSTPQGNTAWQGFPNGNLPSAAPYQYGQIPPQNAGGLAFTNQHAFPGGFPANKSLFNPQTRSFIPGNASARGGARGGRKKGQSQGNVRTPGSSSPAVPVTNDSTLTKPKEDSLQQKYGTLANLPKKPPPSQVSPHFNNEHNSGSGTGGPLIVNGNGKNLAS